MQLFKEAVELGATALNDFTDMVTHLIAEEPGSAKYRVRDYAVLLPVH